VVTALPFTNLTDGLSIGGMVGIRSLLLGFGLRAGVDYRLLDGALGYQAFLTRDLNLGGGFNPYLGLGISGSFSGGDLFGTGLLGFDLNLGSTLGLFVEATPGFGVANALEVGARAGLKLNF
jgi:hypothetical protein